MSDDLRDVHELWNTGNPAEWDASSAQEVYRALMSQADASGWEVDEDQVYDDAQVIWDWLEAYRDSQSA